MQVAHILLGRPWQYDRKVLHDGEVNTYTFLFQRRQIRLMPMNDEESKAKQSAEKKEVKALSMKRLEGESKKVLFMH